MIYTHNVMVNNNTILYTQEHGVESKNFSTIRKKYRNSRRAFFSA